MSRVSESISQVLARQKRYSILDSQPIQVTVVRGGSEASIELQGHLLDISRGGLRLALPAPLKFQEAVSLRLRCAERGLDLAVHGEVCWVQSNQEETWIAGCAFYPELPLATLESLFASGLVERRRHPRSTVNQIATGRWDHDPQEFSVRLVEISQGGLCVRTRQPAMAGAKLSLTFPTGHENQLIIQARAHWQIRQGDEYVLGCTFLNRASYLLLCELLWPDRDWILASARRKLRLSRWALLAGVLVVAGCLVYRYYH